MSSGGGSVSTSGSGGDVYIERGGTRAVHGPASTSGFRETPSA